MPHHRHHHHAPVRLTTEQLRAAWQHRHRADWPPTFEAAMASRLHAGLVRAWARYLAARDLAQAAQSAQQPAIDRKRAAAADWPEPA